MHPVLFHLGKYPVQTYGVLIAIGFLLCVAVAKQESRRVGIAPEKIVDLGFWCLLVGMIGARILFIITRLAYFSEHPIEMFYVWEGGLVFYGGPLLALPFLTWYCDLFKIPRWKVYDIAAIALPLAHAFGRLGCLSAGCCYGKPTGTDFGIILHSPLVDPAFQGLHLHPTQVYEAVSLFLLFLYLYLRRTKKKFDGELTFTYVISYCIIRSIIEIFRGDSIRGFVIDDILSTSQFISILIILVTMVVWKKRKQGVFGDR